MNYFSDEIDSRRRLMLKYSVLAAGGIYSLTLANRVLAVWPASLFEHQAPDSLLDELTEGKGISETCLLYTSPSPRDATLSRMPSSA